MARLLVNWENHATQSAYDMSLTLKLALFYSINCYFSLFYIAAVKQHITIAGQKQVSACMHACVHAFEGI